MEPPRFKVILLGDTTVGKTSIARRQAHSKFDFKMLTTVGVDHMASELTVNEQKIKLMLWDTAGQEEFASLVPMYVRGAHVCIIVGSIIDPDSCAHLELWQSRLEQSGEKPPIVIAINKTDLADGSSMATEEDIRSEYKKLFQHIFFVSARTGDGIEELFQQVGVMAINLAKNEIRPSIDITKETAGDSQCAC